ncbi:hypothetical protein ACRE_049010 [Hapsidospora chrysogenum ATCC 11550]|uniref:Uncharacterized protein n=1 Tax=Hapsidospora chrysogenum (strain ATCC 11550 / CBS 779.69 / DSM 880 / IAM 14645 / JCM 23072 / IMI 49137) TaxID=857340 RepID=A0A086T4S3_HAPC1|nr:hypothetical protein ACRE_049010 [Hapsidospora chrysogenum ATCC 11550]
MDSLLSKPFDSQEQKSPGDLSASSLPERTKALAAALLHRLRRGGVSLLLRVAAVVFAIFLLVHLVPPDITDRYHSVLSWSSADSAVKAADLRMVVFGSQDLLGSSSPNDTTAHGTTWAQKLCKELSCSSLLSFVPNNDYDGGLTSNRVYQSELDKLMKVAENADVYQKPAADLLYLKEQYPTPQDTPDLGRQVQQFVSLEPPEMPPHETIWVFSFGTWDIWKLAAMPLQSGAAVVDALASHIFDQVEYLYSESLDERSIAYSDFWKSGNNFEADGLVGPDPEVPEDKRMKESFRVVIPQLFDISLAPGWQDRPSPPVPHSAAEQLRNSAVLTARWNAQIKSQMEAWMKKDEQADDDGVEGAEKGGAARKRTDAPPDVDTAVETNVETDAETDAGTDEETMSRPYPQRLGYHADPARSILDAMTEGDMQRSGVRDSKGRGTLSASAPMGFTEVWTPCMTESEPVGKDEKAGPSMCKSPDAHLFRDNFTLGQRAINELAKQTARGVMEHLLSPREVTA